jgi:UDP-N-acetylglucosamine/UDP-N-acetylgalactosamine diphosphorylase
MDESGRRVEPAAPNAVKLEAFIFDAIPLAAKPIVLQTVRAEEFSPVKNATGVDSAETSRRDMNRRAAAWLHGAGFDVPARPDNEPDGLYEISPLLALDGAHLREVMTSAPVMSRGEKNYYE